MSSPANFDLLTFALGRTKRQPSTAADLQLASVGIGASNLAITDSSGNLSINSVRLVSVADPVNAQDAATKNWASVTFLTSAQADLAYVPLTQKGAANGVATLDANSKVPVAQLPNSVMEYQGNWDPSTNSPALSDASGNPGDVYWVTSLFAGPVAGLADPSMVNFQIGDLILYSGSAWQLSTPAAGVSFVNGAQGSVTVNAINQLTGDVTAAAATGSQSKASLVAAIQGTTVSGTTGSGNVVFSAAPTLSGLLTIDTLSAGAGGLTVGATGDITKIRGVTYSFPASQAASAGLVLTNDSAGALSWASVASALTAGNGIDITGSTVSAKVDNSSLDFSGSNLEVKALGITAAKLAADSVTTVKILDANVTTAKIADANVTIAKLATVTDGVTLDQNGTGGTLQIKTAGVTTLLLGTITDGITLDQSGSGSSLEIKALGVSAAQLAADAVTTVKILDANVTLAKLASLSVDENKLTTSVAGAGLTGGAGSALAVGAGTYITVNANDVTVDVASLSAFQAGSGLTATGGVLSANVDDVSVELVSNQIAAKRHMPILNGSGADVNPGDVVFLADGGSGIAITELASPSSGNAPTSMIGIIGNATITDGGTGEVIVVEGYIEQTSSASMVIGSPQYLSVSTPGTLQSDLTGYTAGMHVISVGAAFDATRLVFESQYIMEY